MVNYREVSDDVNKMVIKFEKKESGDSTRQILPPIDSLVKPMQMVRCYVLGQEDRSTNPKKQKKVIMLSMRQSLINRGLDWKIVAQGLTIYTCVHTKEDHGYTLTTGVAGMTCFLPDKGVPLNMGELIPGQPLEVVVSESNPAAKTVTVRAHPKAVREAKMESGAMSLHAIVPGMLFNVLVDKVAENGLLVGFLGLFHGVIDHYSLSRLGSLAELAEGLKGGSTLLARVIYVDYGSKSVRLSLRPHILDMRYPADLPALGSTIEDLTICTATAKHGVLLTKTREVSTEEEVEEKEGKKSNKRKELTEALKLQRKKDEAVLGVFLPKKALAAIIK